jgi:hypothetical protein
MGKWLWLGSASVAVASVSFYCHFNTVKPMVERLRESSRQVLTHHTRTSVPVVENDVCDTIEPLLVEGSPLPQVPNMDPATDDEPTPRVVLAEGMRQPPRPDAESDNVLRMPYADEDEVVGSTTNPVREILEELLSRLNVVENGEERNPAEESELKDLSPPMQKANPEPDPALDYHRQYQHCPYSGAYANPYRRY